MSYIVYIVDPCILIAFQPCWEWAAVGSPRLLFLSLFRRCASKVTTARCRRAAASMAAKVVAKKERRTRWIINILNWNNVSQFFCRCAALVATKNKNKNNNSSNSEPSSNFKNVVNAYLPRILQSNAIDLTLCAGQEGKRERGRRQPSQQHDNSGCGSHSRTAAKGRVGREVLGGASVAGSEFGGPSPQLALPPSSACPRVSPPGRRWQRHRRRRRWHRWQWQSRPDASNQILFYFAPSFSFSDFDCQSVSVSVSSFLLLLPAFFCLCLRRVARNVKATLAIWATRGLNKCLATPTALGLQLLLVLLFL